MSEKPTYDELAANVERLRDAIDNFHYRGGDPYLREILKETPAQSLNHIKAQVEEETIMRCAKELKEYGVAKYIEEYVTNIKRKYTKDGE